MRTPKRALLIAAVTTLVSCSSATTPTRTPVISYTQPLRIYTTSVTRPLFTDLSNSYSSAYHLSFETRTRSARDALDALSSGETPYVLTNYLPPDSLFWAAPIAEDGIAVIVNRGLGSPDLSLSQLRDLFQGYTDNWQQLGGPNQAVVLVSREDSSGTRAAFEAQVMGLRSTSRSARIASSSEQMLRIVASTPGAVGYVSLAQVDTRINLCTLDGQRPSRESVNADRYPLRMTLYITALAEPEPGPLRDFIAWVQSQDGQTVVAQRYSPLFAALLPTP